MIELLVTWGILSFFMLLAVVGPKITDRYEYPHRDNHWTIKQCIFVSLLSGPLTWAGLVIWFIVRLIINTFKYLGK